MTKLSYPAEGMMSICRGNIEDAGNRLSSAFSDSAFDIPSGFPQRDYLYGLSDRINDFRDRLNTISTKIQDTDRSLRELSENLKVNASNIEVTKLQKRERTIV